MIPHRFPIELIPSDRLKVRKKIKKEAPYSNRVEYLTLPKAAKNYPKPPRASEAEVKEAFHRCLEGRDTEILDPVTAFTPCVYCCLDERGEVVYVGYSAYGITRALRSSSPVKERLGWFEGIYQIVVTYFDDADEALEMETELIALLRPVRNTKGKW